ncbi:MAG: DUF2442 domain-containing protein [Oligoflexia bacterium]|nr:DUF2442 domain-containing protein [Oligoflexia bacterium]
MELIGTTQTSTKDYPTGVIMLKEITSATYIGNKVILLTFDDGKSGQLNLADFVSFTGYLSALSDDSFFKQFYIDKESGTLCWPNGIDFCPDSLYNWVFAGCKLEA